MPGDDLEKHPNFDVLDWRPRHRKTRGRRATAVKLVIAVVVFYIFYSFILGQGTDQSPGKPKDTTDTSQTANPVDLAADLPHSDNSITAEKPAPLDTSTAEKGHDRETDRTPSKSTPTKAASANREPSWPRADLTQSLRHLLSTLPDELQVKNLLRPLDLTGEARLRDLGLRTRHFKEIFEAWERLHIVPSEDGEVLYVRDDVISYIQRHPEVAKEFSTTRTDLIHSYETYRSFMTQFSTLMFPWTAPYYSDHMHLHAQLYRGGRGLVFTAGDNHAPFLLTSIPTLREMGCHLPVEVFYLGDHDLSEDVRAKLEALPGVTTRDLSPMVNDAGWKLAGWAGKPFAILFSSFREALFIDADSLFFQNPEVLFDDEAYVKTGALFFKDRLIMPESKRRWLQDVLPKPISAKVMQSRFWTGDSGHMQESGVVVVDKWRHFVPLLLVTRMNGPDRDGNKEKGIVGTYDMMYGDKETFWIGWELANDPDYAFHDGDAGTMGVLEKPDSPAAKAGQIKDSSGATQESYTICAPQLLHLDRSGRPLWFNGWLLPNKYKNDGTSREPKLENFLREPREVRDPGSWQLRESNVCCLTADDKFEFTAAEKETLDMIIAAGRKVGALGKTK